MEVQALATDLIERYLVALGERRVIEVEAGEEVLVSDQDVADIPLGGAVVVGPGNLAGDRVACVAAHERDEESVWMVRLERLDMRGEVEAVGRGGGREPPAEDHRLEGDDHDLR
jgi:hypothetical protein